MGPLGWQTRGVPEPPGEPCVLLKLGEIVLKGRNRQQFEHILHGNIRAAARDTGVPVEIRQREGVVLLRIAEGEKEQQTGASRARVSRRFTLRATDCFVPKNQLSPRYMARPLVVGLGLRWWLTFA